MTQSRWLLPLAALLGECCVRLRWLQQYGLMRLTSFFTETEGRRAGNGQTAGQATEEQACPDQSDSRSGLPAPLKKKAAGMTARRFFSLDLS